MRQKYLKQKTVAPFGKSSSTCSKTNAHRRTQDTIQVASRTPDQLVFTPSERQWSLGTLHSAASTQLHS